MSQPKNSVRKPSSNDDSKNKKRLLLALLLLLLLAGGAAAWLFKSDPVAKVKEMRQELQARKDLSAEERRQAFKKLGTEVKKLSPQQRKQLFAEAQKKQQERYERFFKLPPAQQKKELDRDIDRMLASRAARQRSQGAGQGGAGGGNSTANRGNGTASGRAGSAASNAQANAGNPRTGGPGGGAGGGPGSWQNRSPEQREAGRQMRLDFSSPQLQAERTDYHSMMNARMQERGIAPASLGGGFGPAGGFGGGRRVP